MIKKLGLKIISCLSIFCMFFGIISPGVYAMKSTSNNNWRALAQAKPKSTPPYDKKLLDEQIKKFIDMAPDVFEVEDELIEEANPIILLQCITKLNEVFIKYKFFIDGLIQYHRKNKTKFVLGASKEDPTSNACSTIDEIRLNIMYYSLPFDAFKKRLLEDKETGSSCNCDDEEIIAYDTCHEIGHVIRYISVLIGRDRNISCGWLYNDDYVQAIIFNNSASKYNYFKRAITIYSLTDAAEWFAEVFAHLECSKDPNGLGLAMRDFLIVLQEYLVKTNL